MLRISASALLVAGLVTAVSMESQAEEWQPTFADGVLQPLPDGFPNMPITLINVDDAGSSSGLYIRSLQQALDGISPVEIRISDEPRAAGGTIHTLADVTANREGGDQGYILVQGSTIGSATDFLTEPVEKETGMSLDDVNFFITTEAAPWAILQRKDAPWGRGFDKFVEYGRAHPGEIKYISPGVGGGLDIFTTWVLDRLGIPVNKVPAANREASLAAVGGGAGDITTNNATSTLKALDHVDVLLVSIPTVPPAFGGDEVGSAADYPKYGIENLAWGSFQGFILAKTVPEQHVQWLHALLAAAAGTDTYKQRAETIPGVVVNVTSTEETNAQARAAYAAAEPIVKAAGLYWEDNQ
jgi:tripartite-type tricarboxylate transporter receptor subunit TctC